MAKRRVNTKFVGIFFAVVVSIILALFLAKVFIFKKNPKKFRDSGDLAVHDLRWMDAANDYKAAIDADPKDLDTKFKYGEVLHELSHVDKAYAGQDRQVWEAILTQDPTHMKALRRLMLAEVEVVEFYPDPRSFTRLHDVAEKIVKLPVSPLKESATTDEQKRHEEEVDLHNKADAYLHISTIAGWLSDIVTPEEMIKDNCEALARLQSKDPSNPDIPYYLAMAYIKEAKELRTKNETATADQMIGQAVSVFEQAINDQPNNPVMRLRFYQVLRGANDAQEDESKKDAARYVHRMWEVLDIAKDQVKAAEQVKPDPAFTDVYVTYAQFLLRQNEADACEALLRELIATRPNDQTARLVLADLLHSNPDPKKRDEAIALLKLPITDPGTPGAINYRDKALLERQTYLILTNYLIQIYKSTADPAKLAALKKEIDETFQTLTEKAGQIPQVVMLQGQIEMLKGGVHGAIDGIPYLEKARDMFQQTGRTKVWELENLLAYAYRESHQTGLAKQQLFKVVDGVPTYIPARAMLTQMLIEDHEAELAQEQLDLIKKISPNEPAISPLQMGIYLIGSKGINAAEIEKALKNMPEEAVAEIRKKAEVSFVAHKPEEGVRLLEKLRALAPADVETCRTLVQIYVSQGKNDQARQVIEEGITKAPSNLSLQILREQLNKDAPKVFELTKRAIGEIADPLSREVKFYEFYSAQNQKEEALKHLDAAEAIKPNDKTILDLRFVEAASASKWAEAEIYATKLGNINADEARGMIYHYRLALMQGKVDVALDLARQLIKEYPQYARSWISYGDALRQQRPPQLEDAIAKYSMALEKQSGNIEAYRGLIECNFALNKQDDAARYIAAALKTNPGDPWLEEQKIILDLQKDATKAIPPREQAVARNPNALGPRIALAAAWWQVAQQKMLKPAEAAKAAEAVKTAKTQFNEIIVKWPEDRLGYAYLADIATYEKDFAGGEKALKALYAVEKYKDSPEPILLLGDFYSRFGKMELAEAAYAEGLAKSKNAVPVQQKVAAFYATQRKFDKALGVLDKDSPDSKVQYQIVEILLADGKITEAQAAVQKRLRMEPRDAQFMAISGFLNLQQGKIPEAQAVLNGALQVDPNNEMALYYLGIVYLRQGPNQIDDAIKCFVTARNLNPNNTQTRVMLAQAYLAHNQVDDQIQELSTCVKLKPGDKDLRMKLIEALGRLLSPRWVEAERLIKEAEQMPEYKLDPDWRRVEMSMWLARNQPEKALTSIREAMQLAQSQPERLRPLTQDYLQVLLKLKKYREAMEGCSELLKNPELAETGWWAYHLRGIANASIDGKRGDAISDFDKALEITSKTRNDDGTALIIQSISDTIGIDEAISRCEKRAATGDNHWRVIEAYLYLSKQDYARAGSVIEKVLADPGKLEPREKEIAYGVAGSIYMLSGDYVKAEDAYQKVLAINPEDTVSLNNLACLWAELLSPVDTVKALGFSRKALEVMMKRGLPDPNIQETHGWALVCNKQLDEGISFIQSALDRSNILEAHYHLGMALLAKNLGPEAQTQLLKAKSMLDDRKRKSQTMDVTTVQLEAKLIQALAKAKQLVDGASAGTTGGTSEPAKP